MIDRQEIMEHADGFGLGANIIEKDYVLGWLLAGISGHPDAFPNWIFKGGTCLRKCHLETYRFSEDLDFTVTERSQIDKRFLTRVLNEVSEWVFEHAGIEMPRETITVKIAASRKSRIAAQGRVGYRGPMRRRRGGVPRIKLDFNGGEILVQEPVARSVNHPYTDSPERGICIRSYSFGEMFAEKVRALADRESPRDLYDVMHLHRRGDLGSDRLSAEPYSLRRARDGNLVLFAVDRETGNIHSCDVNRIKDVEVSGESFAPRYAIDITPNQPR